MDVNLRYLPPYRGMTTKKYLDDSVTLGYMIDVSDEPSGDSLPFCVVEDVTYRGVDVSSIIPDDEIMNWEDEILEEELNY